MGSNTCLQQGEPPQHLHDVPRVRAAGHDVWLFAEVEPLVAAMVRDIAQARQRVWLESYIIADDAVGRTVADALCERAHAGVDVRVLYDAIGSQATPAAFFERLEQCGVKVVAHHTIWETLFRRFSWSLLNRRNHRKTLVIDDSAGYFGGMNLVDTGPSSSRDRSSLPISGGWRDVHLRLAGPEVAELAHSFERSWRQSLQLPNPWRSRAYRRARLPYDQTELIRLFDSGPGFKNSRAARVFARLMRRAQRDILLSMAYFIPSGKVLRELLRARKRGVRVRVVVPRDNDVKLVQYALRHLYVKLLKRGIEIYERNDLMLHSKVMVVDDNWSVVGSCNLDQRSLELNYEILAAIRSVPLATELRTICEHEIAQSTPVTLEQCNGRSWRERLVDRLCYALRAWL